MALTTRSKLASILWESATLSETKNYWNISHIRTLAKNQPSPRLETHARVPCPWRAEAMYKAETDLVRNRENNSERLKPRIFLLQILHTIYRNKLPSWSACIMTAAWPQENKRHIGTASRTFISQRFLKLITDGANYLTHFRHFLRQIYESQVTEIHIQEAFPPYNNKNNTPQRVNAQSVLHRKLGFGKKSNARLLYKTGNACLTA